MNMETLPIDIVYHILLFDGRFVLRGGKLVEIRRISNEDARYSMLLQRPLIRYHRHPVLQFSFAYLRNRKNRIWYMLNVEVDNSGMTYVITLRRTIYSKNKSPLAAGWTEEDDGLFTYRKCERIMY
jgi:hypothetical protein